MDHTIIAARVQAAHDALQAKGYPAAHVTIQIEAWNTVRAAATCPHASVRMGLAQDHEELFKRFDTIEEALDAIEDTVDRAIPYHVWTEDDVNATLGLPVPA
jgi:hypothetical protein